MSEPGDCVCAHCLRGRATAAGIGPPPWGPAEWALIAPTPTVTADPIKSDPGVIAAEAERDDAREAYDLTQDLWLQVTQAQATAEIRGQVGGNRAYVSTPNGLGRLKAPDELAAEMALTEAVEEATERRDAAWVRVIKANGAIAKAQRAARGRLALAESGRK